MPPKKSDLIHVTFHFHKSAIILSVPGSTTLASLKTQLLPALKSLEGILPPPQPTSTSDYQLWDDKEIIEGADPSVKELKSLEGDAESMKKSIQSHGWSRWKTVYVSFKGEDGQFGKPVYTIPDPDDGEPDEEGAAA